MQPRRRPRTARGTDRPRRSGGDDSQPLRPKGHVPADLATGVQISGSVDDGIIGHVGSPCRACSRVPARLLSFSTGRGRNSAAKSRCRPADASIARTTPETPNTPDAPPGETASASRESTVCTVESGEAARILAIASFKKTLPPSRVRRTPNAAPGIPPSGMRLRIRLSLSSGRHGNFLCGVAASFAPARRHPGGGSLKPAATERSFSAAVWRRPRSRPWRFAVRAGNADSVSARTWRRSPSGPDRFRVAPVADRA